MGVSPSMSDEQSQQDGSKKLQAADTETAERQKQMKKMKDHHSDEEYVMVDASEASSASKKRRRSLSGGSEPTQKSDGTVAASLEMEDAFELNGRTDGEKELVEGVANRVEKTPEEQKNGDLPEKKQDGNKKDSGVDAVVAPARVPSPAVHISGGDMVFPDDEEPLELCLFSSDGSAENTPTKPPPPPRKKLCETMASERKEEKPSTEAATITPTPTTPTSMQPDTAPTTPASVLAEDSVTQNGTSRAMGKRKRRKKLVYSSSRKRDAAKTKQDEDSVPTSPAVPALEDKLSISVTGHAVGNGVGGDSSVSAPPSPVYPDAAASHLYPSTPEGAPWRWEDVDPYFDPLAPSDLDNIVRWRKENANFIAANPTVWRALSGMNSKRAVLETMLGDASDAITDRIEYPIRRGRRYRDVWEEKDFLARQKRHSSVGDPHPKAQVGQLKKQRKGAVDGERLLLGSHRDLVYGYDDDLFQEFRACLEDRVKACCTNSPPDTPPASGRRQQSSNAKVEDSSTDASVQEVVFDEEVLPSFPIHQQHPASLGLWKLRKNQDPDFTVVHPASVHRDQIPARWREEMVRHHQHKYELQLQQTDELADPSDGDDEGTGDSTQHALRATPSNSEVTGGLPSFGECLEEDEISLTLAASVSKLVALSMYNWRTAQRVHERAECSIQCAPILEGEAAAAQELEDVYLQLCPPGEVNVEPVVLSGTTEQVRRPRTTQINSVPHDVIAYSVRRDIADNCSLAVAASVEFALGLHIGDVVDVLDRNGCWNYGEVVETYSEGKRGIAKFLLMRFSLWSEDAVEWIAASEGRLLPRGVADGSRPCSVGPTRAHRVRVRYDQSLARELERSFPQRQAKQATAASQMLAHRQHIAVTRASNDLQKTPQKRKRKRPAKAASVASTV